MSGGRISRGGICSKRGHARQTRLTSSYPRSSTSPPLSPPLDGSSSHPSLEPSDVPLDASPQAEPQPSTHPQGLSDSSNNAQPPMKRYKWQPQHDQQIRKHWKAKAAKLLRNMMYHVRKNAKTKRPIWIPEDVMNTMIGEWDTEEYKKKQEIAKKIGLLIREDQFI
ncbi:uncharacterized protein G2W53_014708 [Senna tora]|uniref:Uncharacterized protein n=1 Tax=Senna tora TaxID=362788 RepID=A0A834WU19_9FABA|nr:uncharacterized protein G2W53_014708 [Senna tora]